MDLLNCTLVELRQFAKEKGLKNVTKMKKDELIKELINLDKAEKAEKNELPSVEEDIKSNENSEEEKRQY